MNFPELDIKRMHKRLIKNGRKLESELAEIDDQLRQLETVFLQDTYLEYDMVDNYERRVAAIKNGTAPRTVRKEEDIQHEERIFSKSSTLYKSDKRKFDEDSTQK